MNQGAAPGPEKILAGVSFIILVLLCTQGFVLWFAWILPFPAIVYYVLDAKWVSAAMAGVGGAALFLSGMGWTAILFGIAIYFVAWVMGESIRRSESPFPSLITGTLVFIMLELVLLAMLRVAYGGDFSAFITKLVQQSIHLDQSILNFDAATAAKVEAQYISQLYMLLPSIIGIAAVLFSAANLQLARWTVSKRIMRHPLLYTWSLPRTVAFLYVLALVFVIFGWGQSATLFWNVMNNVVTFAGFLIGVQGIAMLWRIVYHRPRRRLWLGLILITSFIPLIRDIYVVLGLLDSTNPVRRA